MDGNGSMTNREGSQEQTLARVLCAWQRRPNLRLGELLDLACAVNPTLDTMLYRVTDERLAALVEAYVGVEV